MTKLKNSIESFNSTVNQIGEIIRELKDELFEIIQSEEQQKNEKEESLRYHQDNQCMHYGSPRRRRK